MRIAHLNSQIGAGMEAQTVLVNDIPELNKVGSFAFRQRQTASRDCLSAPGLQSGKSKSAYRPRYTYYVPIKSK